MYIFLLLSWVFLMFFNVKDFLGCFFGFVCDGLLVMVLILLEFIELLNMLVIGNIGILEFLFIVKVFKFFIWWYVGFEYFFVILSLYCLYESFCVVILFRLLVFLWCLLGLCWILNVNVVNCCSYFVICLFGFLNLWSYINDLWFVFNVNLCLSK